MFFILCFNVAVLNILAEQPLFTFLPALAALSSFGFTVMATFLSPRFTIAGLTMFVIGILMARLPHYAFLIYGGAWWAILQVLAIIFLSRRRRLLLMGPNSEPTRPAGSPNS
jgi:hypothetical protein